MKLPYIHFFSTFADEMSQGNKDTIMTRTISSVFTVLALAVFKPFGLEAWQWMAYIHLLANVDEMELLPLTAAKPENAMASVNAGVEVYLPLKALIDVEVETARLNKELAGLQKEMQRVSGKLQNQGFLAKAPKEVVEKEQAKAEEFAAKIKTIEERLAYLKTI